MLTNDLVRCKLFLIAMLTTPRYFAKHKTFTLQIIINILLNYKLIVGIISTRFVYISNLL